MGVHNYYQQSSTNCHKLLEPEACCLLLTQAKEFPPWNLLIYRDFTFDCSLDPWTSVDFGQIWSLG